MLTVSPLPAYLIQRFHGWRATTYAENMAWYRCLAEEGQNPRAIVISCCDSRVHVTSIFGADPGEFFILRNIANLVPPCKPDGDIHGTSAAVEYAVTVLRVSLLVVLGQSNCGGVKGCFDMCSGNAPELEERSSFIGRWMGCGTIPVPECWSILIRRWGGLLRFEGVHPRPIGGAMEGGGATGQPCGQTEDIVCGRGNTNGHWNGLYLIDQGRTEIPSPLWGGLGWGSLRPLVLRGIPS